MRMYNNIILERHYKKGSKGGRFKISEKNKKFWKTWDTSVNTSEKQTEGKIVMGGGRAIRFDRKLSIGCSTSKINYDDYKMKVFNCDRATKKMYEEYYKSLRSSSKCLPKI